MSFQTHRTAAGPAVTGAAIVAVEAIGVALPLRRPVGFASGTIETAHNVLVRIHTDAGVTGIAEAQPRPYTYGETQGSILGAVREWFGPRLTGADPLAADPDLDGLEGNHCARAAVEVALADLAGRLEGVSCAERLGGAGGPVAVASMLSFGTPAEMADEARGLLEQHGITTFKAKIGREVALDIAAVTAIRAAVPDAVLYVDANRGWTLQQALAAGPPLIELGVAAIEEPLDLADEAGRRRLAREWPVPLAGDESCRSLAEAEREMAGAVGQVSVKVARTAFRESDAILAACRAAGARAVVGSQYEGALGAWASVAFAQSAPELQSRPAEVANFLDLAGDLAEPPRITGGFIAGPPGPGLGVELDPEALAHYRTEG